MASHSPSNALTFKCGAAISKGMCVKPGSDTLHVIKSAAATSKNLGIALNTTTTAEDKVEIALPGGGAKALLGGSVSFGDLLTADSAGKLVATTTPGDRYVCMAMDDGSAEDLCAVHVVVGLI